MIKPVTKKQPPKLIKHWLFRLADADMVFWLMPPLIAILIAGTLAQRWLGLYEATNMFFTSFIFFAGPIPLPGGFTLLGILSVNLTLKFLLKSDWSWRKSGIILTHLGALILLIGGLITALAAKEYYMLIPEGDETPYIYHYTKRNLVIYTNDKEATRLPYDHIDKWETAELPFSINIIKSCDNCKIVKREEADDYSTENTYGGMAQFMALTPQPPRKDPEANLTGFEFNLTGTPDQDGRYLAFDGMPKPIEITTRDNTYTLIFGKEQTMLPFSIALKDFVKTDYPGTNKAKTYHSDIIVKDGELEWPVTIEMNEPLRYKGYTFFQSSFEQTPEIEMTILAVVKNSGWLVPYFGTALLGIGLLLHILIGNNRRKSA